jgi:predicted hotdog family 3-hydroxylacyl-ACP dehydratase
MNPLSVVIPAQAGMTRAEREAMNLDHAGIAGLIPHAGRMCLLASVQSWDGERIRCTATSQVAADHPLRSASGLLASAAIEYAAQAAAVHGALTARAAGHVAAPGFLASARGVRMHRLRLDDLAGELAIEVQQLAGQDRQLLYAFSVLHHGQAVADGRLAVVLDTPLPT